MPPVKTTPAAPAPDPDDTPLEGLAVEAKANAAETIASFDGSVGSVDLGFSEPAELEAFPEYTNRHRALDAAVQLYARANTPASTVVATAQKFAEFLDE